LALEKEEQRDAGAHTDYKGKFVEFSWWLKRNGYAEGTILTRARLIRILANRGADLYDPESVKTVIADQKWSEGRKANAIKTYSNFLKMTGGKWTPPICRNVERLPFIPTEAEIDSLISACTRKISVFLQIMKETGMRCGEVWQLRWTDIDTESGTMRATPEKGSKPRQFRVSTRLLTMLDRLPRNNVQVFGQWKLKNMRRTYERQRNRLADKFCNPRLRQITFHTLRHWRATTEYHRTRDILHVMQMLGHRNIKNTLKYTQLISLKDDDYTCKTATTVKEASELVESGFEYVTELQGVKLFRKRK
jgi:integrase